MTIQQQTVCNSATLSFRRVSFRIRLTAIRLRLTAIRLRLTAYIPKRDVFRGQPVPLCHLRRDLVDPGLLPRRVRRRERPRGAQTAMGRRRRLQFPTLFVTCTLHMKPLQARQIDCEFWDRQRGAAG